MVMTNQLKFRILNGPVRIACDGSLSVGLPRVETTLTESWSRQYQVCNRRHTGERGADRCMARDARNVKIQKICRWVTVEACLDQEWTCRNRDSAFVSCECLLLKVEPILTLSPSHQHPDDDIIKQ